MQFIKLTNAEGETIVVNPIYITMIQPKTGDAKVRSQVVTADGKSTPVKEDIVEVQQRIADVKVTAGA